MGHYHAQGRTPEAAARIREDADALEQAGAFSVVIEGVLESIAADVTKSLKIPTIGIGASPLCDGQILVTDDLLGLFSDFTPKFVRKYANLSDSISKAVAEYAQDVRSGKFPSADECFR